MKNSLVSVVTIVGLAAMASSCNQQAASNASTVTTGFAITGSGQNAVVQTDLQKVFSLFIPSAIALPPPVLVDSTGISINLNEGWVVVKKIEFESNEVAGQNEVDGDGVEFEGPFYVDLLSASPSVFPDAQVPGIGLRRVKMQLHKADSIPAAAPAGLNGMSIYFSGSVNGIAFTYSADDSTELEIGGPNPIIPKSSMDMLAVIRTADLFKKINLSSILASTNISKTNRVAFSNPCPSIDASAVDLYTCFRKGLETESNFGNDDGDMDLDSHDETVE
jgi:hypothetical protein